jgi:hypothetical protein
MPEDADNPGESDADADSSKTFKELRLATQGKTPESIDGLLPHAGAVQDEDVLDSLSRLVDRWDPDEHLPTDVARELPEDPTRLETYRSVLSHETTRTATDAVSQGQSDVAEFVIGWQDYKNDVSGLHTTAKVEEWLCTQEQVRLIYMAALMGRGKTDLSISFLQVVWYYYRRLRDAAQRHGALDDVPAPQFAANFEIETPSDVPNVETVQCFDDLVDAEHEGGTEMWGEGSGWVPPEGGSSDVRWVIFDEASSELTAQSGANSQKVAEVMAPFVKKMRKVGINMIVIGHDKGDVHPAIRSIADFVDKTSLKACSVYEGIKNREPAGHKFDLDQIPQCTWEFDTDDTADWDWGTALDPEDSELEELREELEDRHEDDDVKDYVATLAAQFYIETDEDMSKRQAARTVAKASTVPDDVVPSRSMITSRVEKIKAQRSDGNRGVAAGD